MKKIIGILLLICMCFSFVGCGTVGTLETTVEPEEKFPFYLPEWVEWGMKEGEVRTHLNDTILEYGDLIYIFRDGNYKKCRVTEYYGFSKDNKLIYMNYTFNENDILSKEKNQYYDIFLECKQEFTKLYGESVTEEENWNDDRYKDDEYMLYKAIEDGDYTAKVIWNAGDYYCSIELNEGVDITFSTDENAI